MRDDEPPHVYVLVNGVIKTSRRGAEVLMEQIYANGHEVAYDHAAKQFLSSALRGLPVEIVEEQELMRLHQGSSSPFVVGSVCHEMDWKSTTPVGHDVLMREALSQIFLRISPPVLDDELDHPSRIVQRRVLVSEDARIMQRMIDAIGRDMYEKVEPRLDRSEHHAHAGTNRKPRSRPQGEANGEQAMSEQRVPKVGDAFDTASGNHMVFVDMKEYRTWAEDRNRIVPSKAKMVAIPISGRGMYGDRRMERAVLIKDTSKLYWYSDTECWILPFDTFEVTDVPVEDDKFVSREGRIGVFVDRDQYVRLCKKTGHKISAADVHYVVMPYVNDGADLPLAPDWAITFSAETSFHRMPDGTWQLSRMQRDMVETNLIPETRTLKPASERGCNTSPFSTEKVLEVFTGKRKHVPPMVANGNEPPDLSMLSSSRTRSITTVDVSMSVTSVEALVRWYLTRGEPNQGDIEFDWSEIQAYDPAEHGDQQPSLRIHTTIDTTIELGETELV